MSRRRPRPRGPDRRSGDRRNCWLVQNWRNAHKWLSVQVAAGISALNVIYEFVPAIERFISPNVFRWLMVAGGVAVILARIKNQQPRKP